MALHTPVHPVRFVTATPCFDGHDVAVDIMRRTSLPPKGAFDSWVRNGLLSLQITVRSVLARDGSRAVTRMRIPAAQYPGLPPPPLSGSGLEEWWARAYAAQGLWAGRAMRIGGLARYKGVSDNGHAEFTEFFQASWEPCLRAVPAIAGSPPQLAEDQVAEAFARAWAGWRKVSRHPAPQAWVVSAR